MENNANAMREALEDARNYLLKHCGSSEAQVIARRIEHILAAPPRNCDLYQDGQSAYNGWRDSFRDKRSPELLFSDWLFETAKEKTDGSK